MSNFHPLEVVGRGSETQLQVGENLNYFKIIRVKTVCLSSVRYNLFELTSFFVQSIFVLGIFVRGVGIWLKSHKNSSHLVILVSPRM